MPNIKIILGLVGLISAGKGTVAEHLEKKYEANVYKFSTMLRDILDRLYLDITRHSMQTLSTILRQNFSEDLMAKVITKDVKKDTNEIVVVDGIRRLADIKYLKKLPEFKLARVVVDPKIRYERLILRAENTGDTKKSFKEFLADDKKEAEIEIPKVMKTAEIELNNNSNFNELYKQIDKIIDNSYGK